MIVITQEKIGTFSIIFECPFGQIKRNSEELVSQGCFLVNNGGIEIGMSAF